MCAQPQQVPSSFAFTVHRLQNTCARDQNVVDVGVDRIGISSEHIKLDCAGVATLCLYS
jgi:hypothetical protein